MAIDHETVQAEKETLRSSIPRLLSHKHPVNIQHHDNRTFGMRIADSFAAIMGSWRFIIIQSFLLVTWVLANSVWLVHPHWDPYPFILLNLTLSFQAAYAAPIIMMSQNRAAARDRAMAELDFETNQKAEQITERLLEHAMQHGQILRLLTTHLGAPVDGQPIGDPGSGG